MVFIEGIPLIGAPFFVPEMREDKYQHQWPPLWTAQPVFVLHKLPLTRLSLTDTHSWAPTATTGIRDASDPGSFVQLEIKLTKLYRGFFKIKIHIHLSTSTTDHAEDYITLTSGFLPSLHPSIYNLSSSWRVCFTYCNCSYNETLGFDTCTPVFFPRNYTTLIYYS